MPGIIAAVFPSVSDAPIRLQGKVLDHVFESSGEIVSSIKTFYVNETLKQVYKIIGSLDFVGNPTILFSSFVSGVRDLVAAPTNAFLKSPTNVNQVGIAVGKGTLSLFSHSASGIFGFAAKMSATAGQAAAILSLDVEYSQWHRDRIVTEATNLNRVWKRRGIQSVPEMLTRPIGDIILGVAMGASGFLISPYKGFKKGGGFGFVRGVAVGTAGLVAKPLVGVLDAFTHFSATVHDVAKSVNVLERRYQPALKIRLPYTFGPMNILAPFDPISARSVYLLQLFPAKSKRNQRMKRAAEIYVHAEVLHMEPGVDSFAIATTARVMLVRLKKDITGSLLPTLGWEVELGDQGSVVSRVSDHGHNGIALTITRRVMDEKMPDDAKDLKGKVSRKSQEALKSTTFSSALSMDSGFSDLEDEEDDIEVIIDTTAEVLLDEQLQGEDMDASNEGDPTFDFGATKKGGEVLKWFTVLAEYQHRKQLTALHNAVSALVGDFDSIITDRGIELGGGMEGTTMFGIFTFEKPSEEFKSIHASNAELVASLELLPWMNEEVFVRIEKCPARKRREVIASIRQNWTYMTDLEGSKREGGPSWLVEARARAMFASSDAPILSDSWDPSDLVVGEVSVANEKKKGSASISKGDSFEDQGESDDDKSVLSETERSFSVRALEISTSNEEVDNASRRRRCTLSDEQISTAQKQRLQARHMSEDDLFHSVEFHTSVLNRKNSESETLTAGSELEPVEQMETPMHSASSFDHQDVKSLSANATQEFSNLSLVDSHGSVPRLPIEKMTAMKMGSEASRIDRMERMETLMEQLVIINAQQVQKLSVTAETSQDAHSSADATLAGILKEEVAVLRSQVRARAAEDDALRNEIVLLRQQLAERRELRNAKSQERPSRLKIPELLRFGMASKKEEDFDPSPGYGDIGAQVQDTSAEYFETPLNDEPQEHRGTARQGILTSRAQGQLASEVTQTADVAKDKRSLAVDSRAVGAPNSSMARNSSTDGAVPRRSSVGSVGITARRSSIGSVDARLSSRRMSGEHQVRWE